MATVDLTKDMQSVLEEMALPFEPAPLQLEDIEEAAIAGRYAFFYDVGVGKTFVSTVVGKMWNAEHTIVVGPPILNTQWADWLRSVGEKDVSVYAGPKRTTELLDHKWVVMSHAIFRDSFSVIKDFYGRKQIAIVIDEAQALKNPESKLFKYVNQLSAPDRNLLLLTATPTTKPQDTYTYMKLKTQGLYRNFGHWQNLHVAARDIFGTITEYSNLELLAENFALKSIVRTKKEVFGHDKDPIYQKMLYDLDPKHVKLYKQLAEEQLLIHANGDKIDATTAQRLRHALQQIVVNYGKFSGNPADRSKAFDIVDQVIDEVQPMNKAHSKLVIWTYYVSTSESVTAYLREKFGPTAVVAAYGKVNSAKAIEAIMNDPECRILVAQPSSCGVGLNLQHVCSENLFLEMATSPMQIKQAMGRTDRAGQTIRPTMRFAQAVGTIQVTLFWDLLRNDDLVARVERTPTSLRKEIFGQVG